MTYYHTIDGVIVSEQTGGVRTEYMHDALGSVTGTTDGSGNLQNQYWWAPYGTQIAKAGTAADPAFQWVGTLGYRATGRPHAASYVRARHYGPEQSSWTTVDRMWPRQPTFSYGRSTPGTAVDPSGLSYTFVRFLDDIGQSICGNGCKAFWYFVLAPYTGKAPSGWLIQRIMDTTSAICCGSTKSASGQPCVGYGSTYYEAFKVLNGEVLDPDLFQDGSCIVPLEWQSGYSQCGNCEDVWYFPGVADCSHGSRTKTGDLMFVEGDASKPPGDFSVQAASCAHCVPMSASFSGFSPQPGGHGVLTNTWSCCLGNANQCDGCPEDTDNPCLAQDKCQATR